MPLLANPKTSIITGRVAFANGYYPYLQIVVNSGNNPACTSGVTGAYTGFQYPVPIGNVSTNFEFYNLGTSVVLNGDSGALGPLVLTGLQCFNNTGAIAYLQVSDSSNGGLGNGVKYQMPILNQGTFTYPGINGIILRTKGWIGASTTLGGGVAVASGMTCMAQVNYYGPFYPFGN